MTEGSPPPLSCRSGESPRIKLRVPAWLADSVAKPRRHRLDCGPMPRRPALLLPALAVNVIIASGTFLVAKRTLAEFPPLTLALLRFVLAAGRSRPTSVPAMDSRNIPAGTPAEAGTSVRCVHSFLRRMTRRMLMPQVWDSAAR